MLFKGVGMGTCLTTLITDKRPLSTMSNFDMSVTIICFCKYFVANSTDKLFIFFSDSFVLFVWYMINLVEFPGQ